MRTRLVALAAATATALSGCSMLSSDSDPSDSSGSSGSSESSESSESGKDSGGESGEVTTKTALAAGIDPEDPPKPIAEGTYTPPNRDDVESTTIELIKLTPKENVMLAVFRFTGEGRGNETTSVFNLLGGNIFRPELIDLEKLEKYSVVEDLHSDISTRAPLGEPIYYFTAFPLPRDGVESMDLRLTEQMGAIEDVPMPQS